MFFEKGCVSGLWATRDFGRILASLHMSLKKNVRIIRQKYKKARSTKPATAARAPHPLSLYLEQPATRRATSEGRAPPAPLSPLPLAHTPHNARRSEKKQNTERNYWVLKIEHTRELRNVTQSNYLINSRKSERVVARHATPSAMHHYT